MNFDVYSDKENYEFELKADYVAGALLMPLDAVYSYLEEKHFRTVSSRRRAKIVKYLSRKYGVEPIVALRRIRQVYMVKQYTHREIPQETS